MNCKSNGEIFNPFTTFPVEPKFFAGRKQELKRIDTIFGGLTRGTSSNIFIEGERSIGKSSLLKYINYRYNEDPRYQNMDILFINVKIGDCDTVTHVCGKIISSFNEYLKPTDKLKDKFKSLKGFSLKIFGTGCSIELDHSHQEDIKSNFSKILIEVLKSLDKRYRFVIIMIDETDSVVKNVRFGRLIKNTIEELDLIQIKNVMIIVTATPNGRKACEKSHSGFIRAFNLIKLSKFEEKESKELIERALKNGRPKTIFKNDAKLILIKSCQGTPGMLQELGQCVFNMFAGETVDRNGILKSMIGDDTYRGSLSIIGEKYFPKLFELEGYHEHYKKITDVYAKYPNRSFTIKGIIKFTGLQENRIKTLLNEFIQHDILEKVGQPRKYRPVSTLLAAYLYSRLISTK